MDNSDRLLFSIIALLMAGIVIVGAAGLSEHPTVMTDTAQGVMNQVTQAVTDVAGVTALQTPPSPAPSPATLTMTQVAAHASASSCYAAIRGSVYDLTGWINQHPGGRENILSICGTDATAAFDAQHGGQGRPESALASFKIGTLE